MANDALKSGWPINAVILVQLRWVGLANHFKIKLYIAFILATGRQTCMHMVQIIDIYH